MIMDRLYGGVCYAGIDTDPELKYPKGAGRVAFSNQQSYIAAISARFVQLQHGDIDKRVHAVFIQQIPKSQSFPKVCDSFIIRVCHFTPPYTHHTHTICVCVLCKHQLVAVVSEG